MYRYYLTHNGTKTEIAKEPIGWDNFETKLSRNAKYHGVSAEYSDLNLRFWDSISLGILSSAYDADIDSVVTFTVENGGVMEYEGQVDFAEYSYGIEVYEYIEVKVADIGVQTTFNNRIDQKVDLDSLKSFDSATENLTAYPNLKKQISLHSMPFLLQNKVKNTRTGIYQIQSSGDKYFSYPYYADDKTTELGNGQFNELVEYANEETYAVCDIDENNGYSFVDGHCSGRIFIDLSQLIDQSSKVDHAWIDNFGSKYPANGSDFLTCKVKIFRKRGGVNTTLYESTPITPTTYNKQLTTTGPFEDLINHSQYYVRHFYLNLFCRIDKSFDFDISDIKTYDSFHVAVEVNIKSDLGSYWRFTALTATVNQLTNINISAKSITSGTNSNLAFVHEALSRITENVTNNQAKVLSSYYGRTDSNVNAVGTNGKGSLKVIGSGLRVRNASLTSGTPAFTASFLDLMKGLAPIDNIGWGFYNGQLRVESWRYFYNNTVVLNINAPKSIVRSVDPDRIYSRVKAGYSKYETEGVNGLDAFCSERNYSSGVKAVDAQMEIQSTFIADSYAIEKQRRLSGNKSTTDSTYDNNIFIFCIKKAGNIYSIDKGCDSVYYIFHDMQFDEVVTVLSQDYVYNARISPGHNFARWKDSILMYSRATSALKFASGTGNYKAAVIANNASGYDYCYASDLDEYAGESGDYTGENNLLLAEIITIQDYYITLDQYNSIKANPYGIIRVNGEDCYLKDMKYKRKTGKTTLTLIPTK